MKNMFSLWSTIAKFEIYFIKNVMSNMYNHCKVLYYVLNMKFNSNIYM